MVLYHASKFEPLQVRALTVLVHTKLKDAFGAERIQGWVPHPLVTGTEALKPYLPNLSGNFLSHDINYRSLSAPNLKHQNIPISIAGKRTGFRFSTTPSFTQTAQLPIMFVIMTSVNNLSPTTAI